MITRKELEDIVDDAQNLDPRGLQSLIEIVWQLRDELVAQLALNLFAAFLEKESQKTIERLEKKITALEAITRLRGKTHNPKDLARITELEGVLNSTLSWLSSYPGGGALNCYDRVRRALDGR